MTRRAVVLLAVATAALSVQWWLSRSFREGWDSDVLPAYDAYAYVAMAEAPSFFTTAPWGYRVLTPWIVHALPVDVVSGFEVLTFAGMLAAMVLLGTFLRRLGHDWTTATLAAAAFAFLPPAVEVVQYPYLIEPLTIALEIAFLACLAGNGSTGVLACLAVLGALSKELQVLLVPLVYFARAEADGRVLALRKTILVGLAAAAATILVRTWTPLPPAVFGRPPLEAVWAAWTRDWPETWRGALVMGLTPLALAGAFLPRTRAYLRRFGYGLAVTVLVPFAAFVNVGDPRVIFFGKNTERLLVYAIPLLLPLALAVVDALRRRSASLPEASMPWPAWIGPAAGGLAVVTLVAAGLGLDRYRRADLRVTRDGPLLLAFCRESLAAARRLERGRVVVLDPERDYFVAGQSDPHDLRRMRWYLRDGWGPRPSSISAGPVVSQDARATVVLPCFVPDDWQVTLLVSSGSASMVRIDVNGRAVGSAAIDASPTRVAFPIPRDALFRGDNLLGLSAAGPGLRLHRVAVRPAGSAETDRPGPD